MTDSGVGVNTEKDLVTMQLMVRDEVKKVNQELMAGKVVVDSAGPHEAMLLCGDCCEALFDGLYA
jgi:hypothetical protein